MRGRRLSGYATYTLGDAGALAGLQADLEALGWTPVGTPIQRAFPGGGVAVLTFQQAVLTFVLAGTKLNIVGLVRGTPSMTPFENAVITRLGLVDPHWFRDETEVV